MTHQPVVAIFTGYYFPHLGGVEKFTASLARYLTIHGFQVVIITNNTEKSFENETVDQVQIFRLPVIKLFKARYPVPNILSPRYRKLLNTVKKLPVEYYIINTRFYLTSFLGLSLARKRGQQGLIIEHGTGHLVTDNRVVNYFAAQYEHFLARRIRKYSPVFYGVSNACTQWLQHFGFHAHGVIYNGIEPEVMTGNSSPLRIKTGIEDDHLVYATACRLIPEKGIPELVQAFTHFSKTHPKARLFVAGEGPLLETLVGKTKNESAIQILGRLHYQDVLSLFIQSDVVILPSRYPEGLPSVLLEAGLAGCAVISTDVGGASEVITSPQYGLLIPKNNEGELVEAMSRLYHDESLRKTMAANLRDRVMNHFTWERTIKKFLSEPFFLNRQTGKGHDE